MRRPIRRRLGFTMIELLIVIAVIALLIGLLIPAIHVARDAARRTRCQSNLRQLGIAFHGYHEMHRQLPPVYVAVRSSENSVLPGFVGVKGDLDDINIHTYAEFLLPFLDQAAVYERIDFDEPCFAPADLTEMGLKNYQANNQDAVAVAIPIFLCPSAPRESNPHSFTWTEPVATNVPVAISIPYRTGGNDYGPSSGIGFYPMDFAPPQQGKPAGEGILSNNNPSAGFSDVLDGMSQTTLMFEIAGRPQLWRTGVRVDGEVTGGGGWADILNAEGWLEGTSDDGTTLHGSCLINCTNLHAGGIYSFHHGGAHVLMCDGSVHFIAQNVSPGEFVQLVTCHGSTAGDVDEL